MYLQYSYFNYSTLTFAFPFLAIDCLTVCIIDCVLRFIRKISLGKGEVFCGGLRKVQTGMKL